MFSKLVKWLDNWSTRRARDAAARLEETERRESHAPYEHLVVYDCRPDVLQARMYELPQKVLIEHLGNEGGARIAPEGSGDPLWIARITKDSELEGLGVDDIPESTATPEMLHTLLDMHLVRQSFDELDDEPSNLASIVSLGMMAVILGGCYGLIYIIWSSSA